MSLELLRLFVGNIEHQIDQGIQDFRSQKETMIEDSGLDQETVQVVEMHNGIRDDAFDLKTVFEEYLPNLQRSSALNTLCGFFENELDKLCHLLCWRGDFVIKLTELNGKGIFRSSL